MNENGKIASTNNMAADETCTRHAQKYLSISCHVFPSADSGVHSRCPGHSPEVEVVRCCKADVRSWQQTCQ